MLIEELAAASGAVSQRTTIPILSHALLRAEDKLSITATDLEFTVSTECEANVYEAGAGTIQLTKLLSLAKLLPKESLVTFSSTKNHWFDLVCDGRKYKMPGFEATQFPQAPPAPKEKIELPGAALSRLVARSAFAVSDAEARYTLNGALLILSATGLRIVATDGHRMVVADAPCEIAGLPAAGLRVLVPKRALVELTKMISGDESVSFGQTEAHLFFGVGKRALVARMLTGQFPNYEAVLPKGNDNVVSASCDELVDVLRRTNEMAEDRTHGVKLILGDGGARFESKSPEYGEAVERLSSKYAGGAMEIGFNCEYLLDFLAAAPPGEIQIKLKSARDAAEFSPAGGDPYRYVVMPLAIG